MNIRFIKSSVKKKILQELNALFGISKLPYLLIESGKSKIRAFSGSLSKDEIKLVSRLINIEIIGAYFLKEEENHIRLSLDAAHLLKDEITKNIIEISSQQLNDWIRGRDLDIQAQKGVVIIKNNNDLIGCGMSNGSKIFNYVPKERRLRSNN